DSPATSCYFTWRKAVLPAAARVQRARKMTRNAMTMQGSTGSVRVQVCVVPGIIRISQVVEIDGKSG
ncbi:MAG: hypothetical protein DMG34_21655, partial [Acidobacteria bacterium]